MIHYLKFRDLEASGSQLLGIPSGLDFWLCVFSASPVVVVVVVVTSCVSALACTAVEDSVLVSLDF